MSSVRFYNKDYETGYLVIENKEYRMPSGIQAMLCVRERIIILLYATEKLNSTTRPHGNSNVIGVNMAGNYLWEIERTDRSPDETPYGSWNPYHKVALVENDITQFQAWNGDHHVLVSVEDGTFLRREFTK